LFTAHQVFDVDVIGVTVLYDVVDGHGDAELLIASA
jgi:hypothetical protein